MGTNQVQLQKQLEISTDFSIKINKVLKNIQNSNQPH